MMEIQLEPAESHTIRSYTDHSIDVANQTLVHSCIITRQSIQSDWDIQEIEACTLEHVQALVASNPDVIILGHSGKPTLLPQIASALSKQKIGLECMSIGAACRTFNVLLSEDRAVVLGIILATPPQTQR